MKKIIPILVLYFMALSGYTGQSDAEKTIEVLSRPKEQVVSKWSYSTSKWKVELTIPWNLDFKKTNGPDFEIVRFTDNKGVEVLGAYFGNHPNARPSDEKKKSK